MKKLFARRPGRPGSPLAQKQGCICPVIDNHHGLGYAGNGKKYGWLTVPNCPVHGKTLPNVKTKGYPRKGA